MTMLSHEMDYPICLCKSFIRTSGAFKSCGLLFGMSRSHMDCESLGMEKLLLTGGALKRKMAFMILQMIVHRILILLYGLTNVTDELTVCVFLIGVCHLY